jgi:phosphatidylglycerophosphate synthase
MESIKELREICQGYRNTEEWYVRLVLRPISIYLTKFFILIGVSANQITYLSIPIGIVGCLLYSMGGYFYSVAAILTFHLFIILDCCDGEVARYRKTTGSALGLFLDVLGHDLTYSIFFMCMGIGLFRLHNNYIFLVMGFSSSMTKILFRLTESRLLQLFQATTLKKVSAKAAPAGQSIITRMKNTALEYTTVRGILPVFLVGSIVNRVECLLAVYSIFLPAVYFAQLVQACIRLENRRSTK